MTTATQPALAVPAGKKVGPSRGEHGPGHGGWFARITLTIVCFLWVVPTLGLFLTSFRPLDDANNTGWWTLFTDPSTISHLNFDNYKQAINQAQLGEAFINSIAIALPATFIPVLVAAFAAYSFTFMEFP